MKWTCGRRCAHFPNTTAVAYLQTDLFDSRGFLSIDKSDHGNGIEVAILSFRGSVSLRNWVANLWSAQTDSIWNKFDKDMRIHSGFHLAYIFIREKLNKELQKLYQNYKFSKLLVTGHSQGGVLAVLAAVDILENLHPNYKVEVITIGQPRIGNSAFSSYVNHLFIKNDATLIRVTNSNDLIPHLPLSLWGFQHH
ncbi:alpha/beta-hydrolase, partial [Rozella allomycis CSF55]